MKRRGESPILVLLLLISIAILSLGLIVNLALPVVLPFIEKKIVEPLTNHNEEFVQDDNSADSFSDGECILNLVYWEAYGSTTLSSDKNMNLNLVVEAENCSNAVLTFEVFYENGTLASRLGQASFANGKFFKTWKAGHGPQYYFKVYGGGGALNLRSPKLTILLPEIPECSDGIDNDLDGLIDYPADLDCLSLTDDSESEEIELNVTEECPIQYGNNLTNPKICDFRFTLQSATSSIDWIPYGINNDGWSIGGSFFAAGSQFNFEETLAISRQQVENALSGYLENNPEINQEGLILIDIELSLGTKEWGEYMTTNPELFDQVLDALEMRLEVARELLPNAKLGLYNTPLGARNEEDEEYIHNIEALRVAGERGVFDNLDYMMPNVYIRYQGRVQDNLDNTRNALNSASTITNSHGNHFRLVPLLSGHIAGTGGPGESNSEPVSPEMLSQQMELIQQGNWDIPMVALWAGNDNYNNIDYEYLFREARVMPTSCFCSE